MIIVEDILDKVFVQLPPYIDSNSKSFPIRFEWGDQPDLLLYLKTISGNKYPLIWLVSNDEKVSRYAHTLTKQCRLILAKDSKHVTNRNPTVWKTEFKDCLNPLLENVLIALEKSGVTMILNEYTTRREANYTEEDQTKATDFWNVIVLDIELKFTEKSDGTEQCINTIKFN